MDDDGRFMAWFGSWRKARPDDTPIGWYAIDDLQAAFNAGGTAEHEHVITELFGPERAAELLRAQDDRPGKPVSPPQDAGPVPAQD